MSCKPSPSSWRRRSGAATLGRPSPLVCASGCLCASVCVCVRLCASMCVCVCVSCVCDDVYACMRVCARVQMCDTVCVALCACVLAARRKIDSYRTTMGGRVALPENDYRVHQQTAIMEDRVLQCKVGPAATPLHEPCAITLNLRCERAGAADENERPRPSGPDGRRGTAD